MTAGGPSVVPSRLVTGCTQQRQDPCSLAETGIMSAEAACEGSFRFWNILKWHHREHADQGGIRECASERGDETLGSGLQGSRLPAADGCPEPLDVVPSGRA